MLQHDRDLQNEYASMQAMMEKQEALQKSVMEKNQKELHVLGQKDLPKAKKDLDDGISAWKKKKEQEAREKEQEGLFGIFGAVLGCVASVVTLQPEGVAASVAGS